MEEEDNDERVGAGDGWKRTGWKRKGKKTYERSDGGRVRGEGGRLRVVFEAIRTLLHAMKRCFDAATLHLFDLVALIFPHLAFSLT